MNETGDVRTGVRWGAPFHAHHQPPCSPDAHPLSAPFFTCYRVQG